MLKVVFEMLKPTFENYLMILITICLPNAVLTGVCIVESMSAKDIEKKKDYRAWMWAFIFFFTFGFVTAMLWKFNA